MEETPLEISKESMSDETNPKGETGSGNLISLTPDFPPGVIEKTTTGNNSDFQDYNPEFLMDNKQIAHASYTKESDSHDFNLETPIYIKPIANTSSTKDLNPVEETLVAVKCGTSHPTASSHQDVISVNMIEQTLSIQTVCDQEIESTDRPPIKRQKINDETTPVSGDEHQPLVQEDSTNRADEEQTDDSSLSNWASTLLARQFQNEPQQLTGAWKSYQSDSTNNYLRGCKWAPDGTCLLTNSNDNTLRIFNLPQELYYDGGEKKIIPELMPAVSMKEADTVYDFCWFPLMSSMDPDTACLAVSSKDTPVHLFDAFTGDIRCSYRAYNHLDEIVAAHCVEFSPDGSKLYCGFNKMVRVFDASRPGREFTNRPTFAKDGQRGIISCIAHSPTEEGLYAAGSYSRSVALYSEPAGEMVCMFEGQQGGVTQVKFSPDGTKLYSGGRKDNEILCWDMRNPGQILFILQRSVLTNQRIYFDITGNSQYVVSGSHDGTVLVWDTLASPVADDTFTDPVLHPTVRFQAHMDTVNGVSLHKTLPLLATSSGQRHFRTVCDSSSEDSDQEDCGKNSRNHASSTPDNSLRLWWT